MHKMGKSAIVAVGTALVILLFSVMAVNRFASMESGEGSLSFACMLAAFGAITTFVISYRIFSYSEKKR